MTITLVINPSSTSKTYALYNDEQAVFSMRFERTSEGFGVCREHNGEQQICESIAATDYSSAIDSFISEAIAGKFISGRQDIDKVGVRLVAPGRQFTAHQQITDERLEQLTALAEVVPLHVPPVLEELRTLRSLFSELPVFGISDSAFHTSIPYYRRQYGIASSDAEEYGIERYGFHGLSVASIARRSESFFGVAPDRVVVLHVGAGVSATALHYAESVDTSMGYTPARGVMMGSRVGTFDADALVAFMARKGMRSISTISNYLNQDCGFLGRTGYADMRLILNQYSEGNQDAAEALQVFRHQLHRQIGGHVALLGGLDAFVFTGTAVLRNPFLRGFILDGLMGLGLSLNSERNDALVGDEGMIHADRSDVSIGVMKSDELGEIARETARLGASGL